MKRVRWTGAIPASGITAAELRAQIEGKRPPEAEPAGPQQPMLGAALDPAEAPAHARPKRKYPPKTKSPDTSQNGLRSFERKVSEKEVQDGVTQLLRRAGWLVTRFNSGGRFRPGSDGKAYVFNYIVQGFVSWCNRAAPTLSSRLQKIAKRHKAKNGEGLPDVFALKGDRFLLIEVKRKGGKLRDAQELFIEYARRFGVTVHVFDSWQQAYRFIEEMTESRLPIR